MGHNTVNIDQPEAHPLFPIDEDSDSDDIKPVTSIHIARKENGKLMVAPRMRSATVLVSLEAIHGEFGGGEYVLIGYNNGKISNRRTINLSGKPKPMFDDGIEVPAPQAQAAPPPVDPMAAMMGGQGGIMPLIMLMMQQQNQSADRQTQMFIAMMENSRQSTSEEKAQARAELAANIERERIANDRTMTLMREMMANKSSGNGGGEDFTRGVEFMCGFAMQQIEMVKATSKGEEGDGLMGLLETLGQAFQAAQAVGMFKGVPIPEGVTQVAEAAQ